MRGMIVVVMLVIMGLGAVARSAAAQTSTYTAPLSAAEEVPTNDSPATGQATFEVSADGSAIRYTVTVDNITNLVSAHIHLGMRGENGPIVAPLIANAPPGGGAKSGTIGEGTITPATLAGPLQGRPLSELVAAMQAGNAYVNVHTNSGAAGAAPGVGNLPAGEIRGQIVPSAGGGAPGAAASPTTVPTMTPTPTPAAMPSTMPQSGTGFLTRSTVPASWLIAPVGLGLLLTLALALARRTRRAPRQ